MMHMLRCLFFIEAHQQFHITACHIPGAENKLADDLSHNKLESFHKRFRDANVNTRFLVTVAAGSSGGLDITELDPTVQYFSSKGIADSTQKTYQSALRKLLNSIQ